MLQSLFSDIAFQQLNAIKLCSFLHLFLHFQTAVSRNVS
uniref:Uncharacterized protein n=1 Tax=Anguilla anguilla TaxID=7936 RepID=A0A0E9PTB1_ANGAN